MRRPQVTDDFPLRLLVSRRKFLLDFPRTGGFHAPLTLFTDCGVLPDYPCGRTNCRPEHGSARRESAGRDGFDGGPKAQESPDQRRSLQNEGKISVVGDTREQPKPAAPTAATPQYIASVRKQLEKLEKQLEEVNKQITDLKNFNAGEPSTNASGVQLDKVTSANLSRYSYAPGRTKRGTCRQRSTRFTTKRKKGVEPGDLR